MISIVAPPGSESTAFLEGVYMNVGDPHSSPWKEYFPTSRNSEAGEKAVRESARPYYH